MNRRLLIVLAAVFGVAASTAAAPVYVPGTAASCGTCSFGTLLPLGATGSVGGAGGGPSIGPTGSVLDGGRVFIWDQAGWDSSDNSVTRGDADFAMMVWDVGVALDTLRLYTHQDHYFEPYRPFVAQDMMEYSVWGSNDNTTFTLLSDVVGMVPGPDVNSPTYSFFGEEPSFIYRLGSAEFGTLNAYTRDYTFSTAYRYYGIRSSSLTLDYCGGLVQGVPQVDCRDGDPELDALTFNRGPIVPEPATVALLGLGLAAVAARARRRSR